MLLEDLLRIANSPDVNAVAAPQDAVRDIPIRCISVGHVAIDDITVDGISVRRVSVGRRPRARHSAKYDRA